MHFHVHVYLILSCILVECSLYLLLDHPHFYPHLCHSFFSPYVFTVLLQCSGIKYGMLCVEFLVSRYQLLKLCSGVNDIGAVVAWCWQGKPKYLEKKELCLCCCVHHRALCMLWHHCLLKGLIQICQYFIYWNKTNSYIHRQKLCSL